MIKFAVLFLYFQYVIASCSMTSRLNIIGQMTMGMEYYKINCKEQLVNTIISFVRGRLALRV